MKLKALCLFSGGLDSSIAVKILQEAGVEVIALNFVSHFFGGPSEKIRESATYLKTPVVFVPFNSQQIAVTLNPKAGRGKNFNSCIDCHAQMLKIAGELLDRYGANFIATGEVLGQRPMSQNRNALGQVQQLSGVGELVLRPLSAKLLPENEAYRMLSEEQRDKLLDISGRGVTRQMKLAEKYGIRVYPSHGGGCLLTDVVFGRKMKMLEDDGMFCRESEFVCQAIRLGRFMRVAPLQYLIIGRNEAENGKLEKFFPFASNLAAVTPASDLSKQLPGPHILVLDFTQVERTKLDYEPLEVMPKKDIEDMEPGKCVACQFVKPFDFEARPKIVASKSLMEFAIQVFCNFSKGKGKLPTELTMDGTTTVSVEPTGEEFRAKCEKLVIQ